MKKESNTYNLNYYFEETLREIPEDLVAFKKGIVLLEKELNQTTDRLEMAIRLSKLGVLQRIIGALAPALANLTKADDIYASLGNTRRRKINKIRLAQTLQFSGFFEKATNIYQELEKDINDQETDVDLLDFIYQHKGKNFFEQGLLDKALVEIEKALSLRKEKGNASLIASSEYARTVMLKKKNNNKPIVKKFI